MLFVHFLLLGVTHRDLKLENILLSEDNQPIVTDFGFARYIGSIENQRARSRTFCGSYAYVAPEILQGTHVILDCYLVIAWPVVLFSCCLVTFTTENYSRIPISRTFSFSNRPIIRR